MEEDKAFYQPKLREEAWANPGEKEGEPVCI